MLIRPKAASHHGFSLVELMVGMTVGLFLIGGALTMFVSNLKNSRRMLLEARLNQDLRAAADLITRDLRRASYWGSAINGTIATGTGTTTTANPYSTLTSGTSSITYSYSAAADGTTAENNAVDTNEQFGFQLTSDNVIQMKTGVNSSGTAVWQSLTDPNVIKVTGMTIDASNTAQVAMGSICSTTVLAGAANYPYLVMRQYTLTLTAQAAEDNTVTRQLRTRVKVRNDAFTGACP